MKKIIIALCFFISLICFSVYSYALVDPNLVINNAPAYWSFQQKMWQLGYHMQQQSAWIYGSLIAIILGLSVLVLKFFSSAEKRVVFIGMVIILFLSYPALSHDIFNYLFNAKMVYVYGQDPHVHVALDFPSDDWLRFMHNTHTPAPYGYGWTALSLVPFGAIFYIGFLRFLPLLLTFRVFMIAGFVVLLWLQSKVALAMYAKKTAQIVIQNLWVFALSPLVFIETVGTIHNDVWMMAPAFGSIWSAILANTSKGPKKWLLVGLALLLLAISASTKYATALLLPVVLALCFFKKHPLVEKWWADASAVLLLIPLFTPRAQLFHPWYLIWSLSFVPFLHFRQVRHAILGLSVSSLFRYIPYISVLDYPEWVLVQQQMISIFGGLLMFAILEIRYKLRTKRSS